MWTRMLGTTFHRNSRKCRKMSITGEQTNWFIATLSNNIAGVSRLCSPWVKSSPLLVFINKVLLECNHAHLFKYCLCLLLDQNSRVLATETIWAAKPKIFTICPFTDKVCWALAKGISHCDIWHISTLLQYQQSVSAVSICKRV